MCYESYERLLRERAARRAAERPAAREEPKPEARPEANRAAPATTAPAETREKEPA